MIPHVVVVPGLDAGRGGVAAYAVELARRMSPQLAGVSFLSCSPLDGAPADVRGVARQTPRDARALSTEIFAADADAVLIHYASFGFAENACPAWLSEGIAAVKRRAPDRRVWVYFHELATEEPWWTRTFWTQPQQRRIIRRICQLADRVATSCPHFARRLRSEFQVDEHRLVVSPVPATLARNTQASQVTRKERLTGMVFGLPGTRSVTLRAHRALLVHLAERRLLDHLLLVGHRASADEAAWLTGRGVVISAHPDVDERQFAAIAGQADFGLVWNWPSILTKSTVFANLCALGVPAVIRHRGDDRDTGLPVFPAAISCDGDRASVDQAARHLHNADVRQTLANAGLELARTHLGWDRVTERLATHFAS